MLPVIINNRSNWSASKLRIFCTASGVNELEKDHRGLVIFFSGLSDIREIKIARFCDFNFLYRMAILLSKFRIDYSDLVIITDADEEPKNKTKKWFDGIIQPLLQPEIDGNSLGPLLTKAELESFQYKTDRYLRMRELLLDHSSDSNLVVM